nr:hypothetical protein [Tanacetum cinerariifolium]
MQPPNTHVDKKDFDFDEILGIGTMKALIILTFLFFSATNKFSSISEHDAELKEDQDEDCDDGDIFNMWDVTFEDVERIRKFITPNFPDEMDEVIQPLIPQPIQTIPPNNDYIAPATKLILDEFRDEIMNVTMVDEEADLNPTRDIEELERLLAKDPQSHFMKIHVHSVITKPDPFIHTQPMSPLYGTFESYKSSTKPYKVDREMKSPSMYDLKISFSYPVANEHSNGVYCYFHPHLIPSEGMDTLLPSK